MYLSKEKVTEMFTHYIEQVRCNQQHRSDSQSGLMTFGSIREAEKWLALFGIDTSYERIQPMVEGKAELRAFDTDCDPEEPWYTENWYEDDLRSALAENGLPDDDAHMKQLKEECLHLFDDKSSRNEMLEEAAAKLFPPDPKERVKVYKKSLNADGYGDFVRCLNCGEKMLISFGGIFCKNCENPTLEWADINHEECSIQELEQMGHTIVIC